jgi:hypothetical protein
VAWVFPPEIFVGLMVDAGNFAGMNFVPIEFTLAKNANETPKINNYFITINILGWVKRRVSEGKLIAVGQHPNTQPVIIDIY